MQIGYELIEGTYSVELARRLRRTLTIELLNQEQLLNAELTGCSQHAWAVVNEQAGNGVEVESILNLLPERLGLLGRGYIMRTDDSIQELIQMCPAQFQAQALRMGVGYQRW